LTLSISDREARDTTTAYGDMSSGKEIAKSELKWSIYPNPVVDIVRITGLEGAYTIKMVDAVGQVVASAKGSSAELEFNLSSKPAGIYLIRIESQGKSITRKLIKK
jgi:hypothetical protein